MLFQIISLNSLRGYLVHRPASSSSPAAEGWVPAHVVQPYSSLDHSALSPLSPLTSPQGDGHSKKSWIKFRKPSFSRREHQHHQDPIPEATQYSSARAYSRHHPNRQQMTVNLTDPCNVQMDASASKGHQNMSKYSGHRGNTGCIPASPESPIRIITPLKNVTVHPGEPAEMTCVISGAAPWAEAATITWHGPRGEITDPRFELEHHRDGTLKLHLAKCRESDAGEYTCTVFCSGYSVSCSARINLASGKDHDCSNGHSS